MDPVNLAAIIVRFFMIYPYIYLVNYFVWGYRKSKSSGYKNNFFLGNSILFAIAVIFHVAYASYELYISTIPNATWLSSYFPWKPDNLEGLVRSMSHQVRPLYLLFYLLLTVVMAAQVYPLEQVVGLNKSPFTKSILVMGSFNLLLFIPALSYTWVSLVAIPLGFIAIASGIILNIIVNLIIFKRSTGTLRYQSLYGMFAFLLFGFGLALSLEVGWLKLIDESISYRWEVIVGSLIQLVAIIFYRRTYTMSQFEEGEKMEKDLICIRIFKGDFKHLEAFYYYVLMIAIAFLFIFIAWAHYPAENDYSIMRDTISFLGSSDADNNPSGWIFLSIAFVILSVTFFPLTVFQFRKFKELDKIGAGLVLLLYIIASIGMFLLAFFPDNGGESFIQDVSAGRIHNQVALLAIGGFALGLLLQFFLLVKDHIPKFKGKKIYPVKTFIYPAVYYIILIIMIAYTQIYWDIICDSGCWPGDGIYSFPLWEWIAFISMIVLEGWMLWIISKER